MEQDMGQGVTNGMMSGGAGKKNTGLIAGMVVCAILAVGGIGFGVYGMLRSSEKDSQISDLKVQIKEADGTITTIETPEIETTTNDGTTVTITDTAKVSGGPYIENGYFYVPKWGAKFKLSNDLTNYGYAVDQSNQGDSYGDYVVGLTAISKDDYIEHPTASYYNDIFSCSVVTIRAMEDSKKNQWGNTSADVEFNGFNLVIHDLWRTQNCSNEYMAPTNVVAEQLKSILSNPERI